MTDPERLGPSDLDGIAAAVRPVVADPPSVDELDGALFAADQPAAIFGDPATGVVATVECDDGAHIRLLAVDPSARGRGLGHALVQAAEDWAVAAGHRSLVTGADPPYFLWPGVPSAPRPRSSASSSAGTTAAPRRTSTWRSTSAAFPTIPVGTTWPAPGDAAELDDVDGDALVELAARGPARARTRATSSSPARTATRAR